MSATVSLAFPEPYISNDGVADRPPLLKETSPEAPMRSLSLFPFVKIFKFVEPPLR